MVTFRFFPGPPQPPLVIESDLAPERIPSLGERIRVQEAAGRVTNVTHDYFPAYRLIIDCILEDLGRFD